VAKDWNQLGQWQGSETDLLAAVQAQAAQVGALLATPGTLDHQIRSVLLELAVIGQMQQFLLKQADQGMIR
jgi:hypothetical protein